MTNFTCRVCGENPVASRTVACDNCVAENIAHNAERLGCTNEVSRSIGIMGKGTESYRETNCGKPPVPGTRFCKRCHTTLRKRAERQGRTYSDDQPRWSTRTGAVQS